MTDRERIIKLETFNEGLKEDVSEIKTMLSNHIEREDAWRDKADKAYAGKWTEVVLIGASGVLTLEVVLFVFKFLVT